MRFTIFALILVVAFAFAADDQLGAVRTAGSTGGAPSDADIYSQTYDYGNLLNGYSNYSGGSREVADDFELTDDYDVREIVVWMIYQGAQATAMNFRILSDDANDSNPATATEVWSEAVPCVNVDTGDTNWGYVIWEATCAVNAADTYPELTAGVHYYLSTQAEVADNCFILVSNHAVADLTWYFDGSSWARSDAAFGEDSDLFFDLYGETAIAYTTWGNVKTLF